MGNIARVGVTYVLRKSQAANSRTVLRVLIDAVDNV